MMLSKKSAAAYSLFVCICLLTITSIVEARDLILVTCEMDKPCVFRKAYSATINGKDAVQLASPASINDPNFLKKSVKTPMASLTGLYRESTGLIRVRSLNGQLGEVALPSTPAKGAGVTAVSMWSGSGIVYAADAGLKTKYTVPAEQLVALIENRNFEAGAVQFVRNEMETLGTQPRVFQMIDGLLQSVPQAEALNSWRDDLKSTMRNDLGAFRKQEGNPKLLERTLDEGIAAMNLYNRLSTNANTADSLQSELIKERRLLTERLAVISALQKAGLQDAYIEKLNQIGLVSWAHSELRAELRNALLASAESHHQSSIDLWAKKQYNRAIDEARIASDRLPCNKDLQDNYYLLRTEFVEKTAIPVSKPYTGPNKSRLDQIVLELSDIKDGVTMGQDRIEYFRNRIKDGLKLDKEYIPLLLRQAAFHRSIGELAEARKIVVLVETSVQLDQQQEKEWLKLDAELNISLAINTDSAEKVTAKYLADASFKELLADTTSGLKVDPDNVTLLYRKAVASWFLHDYATAREFAGKYLSATNPACPETDRSHVFDLYQEQIEKGRVQPSPNAIPHWISGALYPPDSAFYDPYSGGFVPQVSSAIGKDGRMTTFLWDGYRAVSIISTQSQVQSFVAEPNYDRQNFRMTDVGWREGPTQTGYRVGLRFSNGMDFDIRRLELFNDTNLPITKTKSRTAGWAGNPYFHPFLWGGIFVFDLEYDARGRISRAVPIAMDASRPPSGEPLTFTWADKTNQLMSIVGPKYSRTMIYDGKGRLTEEKIVYTENGKVTGKGTITYRYVGGSNQLRDAITEDDFLDRMERTVLFRTVTP